MDREEGFINLEKLLENDFNSLLEQDVVKDLVPDLRRAIYLIKTDNGQYFFKECPYEEAITELIVNEMLDFAGVKNIKYDLAKINGKIGVISADFKKSGYKYYNGMEILSDYIDGLPEEIAKTKDDELKKCLQEEYDLFKENYSTRNNFELIWHAIDSHFKDNPNREIIVSRLMRQLSIIHVSDMLIQNEDRNSTNWGIEEGQTDVNLINVFDNGEAFKEEHWMALRLAPLNPKERTTRVYKELERFLERSDESACRMLMYLKSRLGVSNLELSIQKVEQKIGEPIEDEVKEKIRKQFKKHQEKVNTVIENSSYFKKTQREI